MKNELGIEVRCENCVYLSAFCKQSEKDCYVFSVKPSALKQRIKELQEQVETFENAYHKSLDAYHNVAEQLEELKTKAKTMSNKEILKIED